MFNNKKLIFQGHTYPVIFYHFHGTKFSLNEVTNLLTISSVTSNLNHEQIINFYEPYIDLMKIVYERYLRFTVDNVKIINNKIIYIKI